jgi:chaperonin GroEL
MKAKSIIKGIKARDRLLHGMKIVSDNVGITLGPKGRNVIIQKSFSTPKITKDGVSVAREIELSDKVANLGVQILKEAANKTNDRAGDGTTTTIVLGESISKEGVKAVTAGMNPMDIKRGIEIATSKIIKEIETRSRNIASSEEIAQVATISSNGDADIGKKISRAFEKVGKDGVITVEEANKSDTFEIEVVKGMNFDRGYISPYFVTNSEKMTCELDAPYILVFEKKISNLQQMLKLLEDIMQTSKPFVIIAEDIEGEALATLIVNRLRGGLKVAAVKAPGFGDRKKLMMEDIAILTGAKLVTEELGHKLENVILDDLGSAKKVIITKDETTIIDGCGDKTKIKNRCKHIKLQIINNNSTYDKEKLEERLAKLSGGVAVLRVGGVTEVEVKEKKDRVEDAYHATKAAISEGIVPGGGSTLLYASTILEDLQGQNSDETVGIKIIKKSLFAPIRKILSNAGLESALIIEKLMEKNNIEMAYDAQNNVVVDAFEAGIVDPTKVVRNSLQSAASIAALLITTESTICDAKELSNKSEDLLPGNNYDMR